jgi:hypothetical protein
MRPRTPVEGAERLGLVALFFLTTFLALAFFVEAFLAVAFLAADFFFEAAFFFEPDFFFEADFFFEVDFLLAAFFALPRFFAAFFLAILILQLESLSVSVPLQPRDKLSRDDTRVLSARRRASSKTRRVAKYSSLPPGRTSFVPFERQSVGSETNRPAGEGASPVERPKGEP